MPFFIPFFFLISLFLFFFLLPLLTFQLYFLSSFSLFLFPLFCPATRFISFFFLFLLLPFTSLSTFFFPFPFLYILFFLPSFAPLGPFFFLFFIPFFFAYCLFFLFCPASSFFLLLYALPPAFLLLNPLPFFSSSALFTHTFPHFLRFFPPFPPCDTSMTLFCAFPLAFLFPWWYHLSSPTERR